MDHDPRRHGAGHDRLSARRSSRTTLSGRGKGSSAESQSRDAGRQERTGAQPTTQHGDASRRLLLVRVGLPAALTIGGIVLATVGLALLGAALLTTAIIAVLVGFFARLTVASNLERDSEEQARRTFRETGRWPRRRR